VEAKRVPWRDVGVYTVLAYVIAWAIWAPLWPTAWQSLLTARTPSAYRGGGLAAAGMFAPAIAAVLMRLFVSREGVRGSLGPIRCWRAYLIAVAGPIMLVAATIGVSVAAGLGEFHLGGTLPAWQVLLLLLVVGTPISAVLALGEEYGWRGYLLPRLLPLGEVKASILVALVWAPWHLPVLLVGLNFPGKHPLAVLAVMTAATLPLSLLFTRLFVASGGAVLAVALFHGTLNAFSDRLADSMHLTGDPFVVSVGGIVGILVTLVAAAAAYWFRHRGGAVALEPTSVSERFRNERG
jgi:uncharacterized protein